MPDPTSRAALEERRGPILPWILFLDAAAAGRHIPRAYQSCFGCLLRYVDKSFKGLQVYFLFFFFQLEWPSSKKQARRAAETFRPFLHPFPFRSCQTRSQRVSFKKNPKIKRKCRKVKIAGGDRTGRGRICAPRHDHFWAKTLPCPFRRFVYKLFGTLVCECYK